MWLYSKVSKNSEVKVFVKSSHLCSVHKAAIWACLFVFPTFWNREFLLGTGYQAKEVSYRRR